MAGLNGRQSQNIGVSPQERSETQLHTISLAEDLSKQLLGFTGSLVDVVYMEEVLFFYDLDGFGGIRSTWEKHPSKNTYAAFGKIFTHPS